MKIKRAFLPILLILLNCSLTGSLAANRDACIAFDLETIRSGLPQEVRTDLKNYYFTRITTLSRLKVLNGDERAKLFSEKGIFFAGEVNHMAAMSLVPSMGLTWFITAGVMAKGDKVAVYVILDDVDPATHSISSKSRECAPDPVSIKKAMDDLVTEINNPSLDNPFRIQSR